MTYDAQEGHSVVTWIDEENHDRVHVTEVNTGKIKVVDRSEMRGFGCATRLVLERWEREEQPVASAPGHAIHLVNDKQGIVVAMFLHRFFREQIGGFQVATDDGLVVTGWQEVDDDKSVRRVIRFHDTERSTA